MEPQNPIFNILERNEDGHFFPPFFSTAGALSGLSRIQSIHPSIQSSLDLYRFLTVQGSSGQFQRVQLNSTQLSSTQLNSTQLNSTQLNSTQLNSTQLNSTQLNATQLKTPNSTQRNSYLKKQFNS